MGSTMMNDNPPTWLMVAMVFILGTLTFAAAGLVIYLVVHTANTLLGG